jgi:hypothetical protein
MAPIASVSQTCGRRRAPSSRIGLAPDSGVSRGAYAAISSPQMSASAATSANVQRHPNAWPSQLASGTPTIVATVSPSNIRPTAWVRCETGTIEAATRLAMPKYAP